MPLDRDIPQPTPSDSVTLYRLKMVEETLKSVSESLRLLATLEQRHLETREALARAFSAVDENDKRIRAVEVEIPTLKMVRGWVITGVVGCTSLCGIAVFQLIVNR
ncbi:MAG: hypothetical protein WC997_02375 [Porticoccaceae bacterium]